MRRLIVAAMLLALLALAPAAGQVSTITICHATLNPDPPYVALELGEDQLDAHRAHPLDMIPAGPRGCNINPSSEPPEDEQEEEPTPVPEPAPTPPSPTPAPQQTFAPAAAVAAPTPTSAGVPATDLPYTGWDPAPLVLLGMAAMMAGLGVWHRWAGPNAVADAWHAARLPRHLWSVPYEPVEIRPRRAPEPPAPPERDELDEMRDVVARLDALRTELRGPDRS